VLGKNPRGKQSDDRICFTASIFFTGGLLVKSGESAPIELETPAQGTTVERKSDAPVEPAAAPGPTPS
jgi:hypothetical protein